MNVCVAIARVLCALVGLTQHCSLQSPHIRMARTTMGLRALSVAATAAVAAAFWSPGVCRTSWSSCAAPRTGHASTSPTRSRAWGPVLPSPSPARTARLGGLRMVSPCGDCLMAGIACVGPCSLATLPLSLRDSQSFGCCKGAATTTAAQRTYHHIQETQTPTGSFFVRTGASVGSCAECRQQQPAALLYPVSSTRVP